ncbi:MAG TPA: phosphate ABC transporter permease subunit PstC, partial [Nitrososphaera sp.]|nr:phosphate ABC transporter permease subunit PstC [Nitrososphaera sp.]
MAIKQSPSERRRYIANLLLGKKRRGDGFFKWVVIGAASYTLLMLALVVLSVVEGSLPVFSLEGLGFFTGTDWNPVEGRESYGALPYVVGTLMTAGIAMVIGVPISLGIAVFISEIAPPKIGTPVGFIVELLAAIPSVIYGLWALFVFKDWILEYISRPLHEALGGSISLFARTPIGLDIFTAGILLAIMIIPIISSISREILRAVPNSQREAAYSLGATRRETVWKVLFPYAKAGLFGAAVIGLGRAVGETIAVSMIIGNAVGADALPTSLFSPGQTLSSIIALEFNEAVTFFHPSALIALGAILFIVTMGINIGAQLLVSRMVKVTPGA